MNTNSYYSCEESSNSASSSSRPQTELREGEVQCATHAGPIELRAERSFFLPWIKNYEIIIAHPSIRGRGFRLVDLGNCSKPDAEHILEQIRFLLSEHIDGDRISPTMYQNLVNQPKLRLSFIEAARSAATPAEIPLPSAPPQEPSIPHATSTTATDETDESGHTCPICIDDINPAQAVMRCQSSPCHYFHRHCLGSWIRQFQSSGNPTCPMCRQGLDIHGGRLNDFLSGSASANLSDEQRTFLQRLMDKVPATDEWAELITLENAQYVGGIMMSFGYGFFRGYNHVIGGDLRLFPVPYHVQVSEGAGYIIGVISRIMKDHKNRSEDERRRRRE